MASEELIQNRLEADGDVVHAPEIVFNSYGNIIGNKDKFSKRSLALLKTSISVTYGNWSDIPKELIDNIWETLQKEFNIPDALKKSMCKTFADQLKTWRNRLRKKYFQQCNSVQIASLIDQNPNSIPRDAWNVFIERESSQTKLLEREQAVVNRAQKTDVHVSGRRSYAQISQVLTRLGMKHTRVDVYKYCRRRLDGTYHPAVATVMESLNQIQSKQGESSVPIDKDALSQLFGQDDRGRTRGIGSRVSRSRALIVEEVNAIKEIQTTTKKAMKAKMSEKMEEFEKRLYNVEAMCTSFSSKQSVDTSQSSNFSSHDSSPHVSSPHASSPHASSPHASSPHASSPHASSPHASSPHASSPHASSPHASSPHVPSPQVSLSRMYKIRSISDYGKFIGQGRGSSQPTPGAIVHHRQMLPIERKISVDCIHEGMQSELLYLGTQGCCTTFGEVEGAFVVWPEYLLEEIEA